MVKLLYNNRLMTYGYQLKKKLRKSNLKEFFFLLIKGFKWLFFLFINITFVHFITYLLVSFLGLPYKSNNLNLNNSHYLKKLRKEAMVLDVSYSSSEVSFLTFISLVFYNWLNYYKKCLYNLFFNFNLNFNKASNLLYKDCEVSQLVLKKFFYDFQLFFVSFVLFFLFSFLFSLFFSNVKISNSNCFYFNSTKINKFRNFEFQVHFKNGIMIRQFFLHNFKFFFNFCYAIPAYFLLLFLINLCLSFGILSSFSNGIYFNFIKILLLSFVLMIDNMQFFYVLVGEISRTPYVLKASADGLTSFNIFLYYYFPLLMRALFNRIFFIFQRFLQYHFLIEYIWGSQNGIISLVYQSILSIDVNVIPFYCVVNILIRRFVDFLNQKQNNFLKLEN